METHRQATGPDAIRQAQLLCFDNDGTLFASHEVANPAIQRQYVLFCRERGLDNPAPSDEEICRLTGKPGPEFYREVLPESLREHAGAFREACLDEECREVLARGRFYEGIGELLRDLRRAERKLALVTNGGERYVDAVARRVAYHGLLDGIYHYGKSGWFRKAEMIRAAMADLGAATAVMVGDRESDIQAAREAGIPFIGCLWGYGDPEEVAGADALASDVRELRAILLGISP